MATPASTQEERTTPRTLGERLLRKISDPVRTLNALQINRRKAVVVSYPKSGRTWLRKIMLDLRAPLPFTHAGADALNQGHPATAPDPSAFADSSVVFLMRDPRDVIVSYHHDAVRRYKVYGGSLPDLLRDRDFGLDHVIRFNLAWMSAGRALRGFHAARYEDLKLDSAAEVSRILRFLGIRWIGAGAVRKACDEANFSVMRNLEASGVLASRYGASRFATPDSADGYRKVRRGKAGGFRDDLSAEDVAYAAERLRAFDYPPAWLASPID